MLGGKRMKEFIKSERGVVLYWIIGVIVIILFSIVLIPPLFNLINKVDPFILGFPFSVFSFFVISMVLAALLAALYYIQNIRGEL
jgi:uncharacterized membrane protein YhhN